MPRSNIDILTFIYSRPGCAVEFDALKSYIGDNAARRLSDLCRDGLLVRSVDWYGAGTIVYALTGKGFDLLSQTHQANQQRAQDRADRAADQARAQQQTERLSMLNRRAMFVSGIISAIVSAAMSILIRLLFG